MIDVLSFLAELLAAVHSAMSRGATREDVLGAIRKAQVEASDAMMREELGQ